MHFSEALEDGAKIKTRFGDVTIELRQIGDLLLPSGRLVACDPFLVATAQSFDRPLDPGRYPVFLSIAHFATDERIALAIVSFSEEKPANWWTATTDKPNSTRVTDRGDGVFILEGVYGYGIDHGYGSFMDLEAAKVLAARLEADRDYIGNAIAPALESYVDRREWANLIIDPTTGLNFIVFSSGRGDGFYSSYWGFDASGEEACLITDFDLLGTHLDDILDN